IGAASDVQLGGQHVDRLSEGLGHAVAVSARGHNRVAGRQGGLGEIDAHATTGSSDKPGLLVTHGIALVEAGQADRAAGDAMRRCRLAVTSPPSDRKSTRLNSSHVAISYAVFCLEKNTHINVAHDEG